MSNQKKEYFPPRCEEMRSSLCLHFAIQCAPSAAELHRWAGYGQNRGLHRLWGFSNGQLSAIQSAAVE